MRKQFIMIMTDTQRLDMVSCYENAGISTPCLDALAREGVKFNKAYTVQPVCGPARSALFTGQYPCVNGSYANSLALGDNVKTIGQRLSDKGIATGYVGKWHLDGGDYFGLGVCPEGWDPDYWYDMRNYLDELSEEDRRKSRDSQTMYRESWPLEKTYAYRCSQRAIDYIRKHKDEDFFLVLSYDEPHDPSLCPEPFASMYEDFCLPKKENVWDTLEEKPPHQQAWSGPRRHQDRDALTIRMKELFGCNSFVDSEIGRVAGAAREILGDDFTLLYTSDHGDMAQSHCLYAKGPAAYEEIAHIPFILWGQGSGEIDTPVSHIDVAATVWDFFGFQKPMMLQGESLLPLVRNGKCPDRRDVFVEFGRYEIDHDGFGGWQPLRCIFDGRYKLVINLLSDDEFYDLEKDPGEMHNGICDEETAGIRDDMMKRLLEHMNEIRDPFRGYWWEQRPWYTHAAAPSWDYTGFTRQREELDYEVPQLDYNTGLEPDSLVRRK